MKCPACSVDNLDDSKFCRECATPLPGASEASVSFTKTLEIPVWDIQPGSIIAEKYRIIDVLGRGGMGVVYKAEDIKLKRTVALKFLPPELTQDSEARERFVQEARAASALDHTNICTIYEIGETEKDQVFISMAFYEGESLKDKIKNGPLEIDEAIYIFLQLSQGLSKAHEKGIVHRDIKPANILFTKDGVPKILDFGLAKLGGEVRLTKVGTTMGTVAYMSPQQAKGEEVDQRSDIWALGVVLYEMLSGELPFKGEQEQTVVYSILNEEPKPITDITTDLPETVEQVVSKALEKDLDKRYQQLGELIEDLRSITEGIEPEGIKARLRRAKLQRRKKAIIYSASAASLLIIAAILLVIFTGSAEAIGSIAVLPLENRSGDPDQNFFVEGMHDDLITELSKIGILDVTSRFSVMRFRGTESSLPEIAEALNVEVVVTGSAQQVGDSIRVSLQLIDVKTEQNLWADSFEEEYRNVQILHREIAQTIALELGITLASQEKGIQETAAEVSPEAYSAYKMGQHFRNQANSESLKKSIDYYQQAIDIDPNYAAPYAGLAMTYTFLTQLSGEVPHEEGWGKVKILAEQAIELDDGLSEAHYSMAVSNWLGEWDWGRAEREFKRSLELNPNSSDALVAYALFLGSLKRHQEALVNILKARELDPLNPWIGAEVGEILWYAGEYERAIEETNKVLEVYPNYTRGHSVLNMVYMMNGMDDEFFETDKKQVLYTGLTPEEQTAYDSIYAQNGLPALNIWIADKWEEMAKTTYVAPKRLAIQNALAGRIDRAFEWLEKAYEVHSSHMMFLQVDHCFDALRSDPRFDDLLRRVGFPEK